MTDPIRAASMRRIRLAMAAVVLIAALEVSTGLLAGSLALLSDAGHLVTDSVTLGLTLFAVSRSRRPAGASHTFGHHRNGIVVAAANGAVLVVIALLIVVTAVARLEHPAQVTAVPVMAVAAVALVVNGAIATSLLGAGGGLGVRSAALHVVTDALTDAAVIVGAACILLFGFSRADAIVSLLIATLVAAAAVRLVSDALRILNEAAPKGVDVDEVRREVAAFPGVRDVHDLHVWSLDSEHRAMSVHVLVDDLPLGQVTGMIRGIEAMVCERFGIEHATVQPECPACATDAVYCDLDSVHELAHGAAARD